MKNPGKEYNFISACGIFCALCPLHNAEKNRCKGCGSKQRMEEGCPILECCVNQKRLETCADCEEYPCKIYDGEPWKNPFIKHQGKWNLGFIKRRGMEEAWNDQKQRINILEKMLAGFEDGASSDFYCEAVSLLSTHGLQKAVEKAREKAAHHHATVEDKADQLKKTLTKTARREGIKLSQ